MCTNGRGKSEEQERWLRREDSIELRLCHLPHVTIAMPLLLGSDLVIVKRFMSIPSPQWLLYGDHRRRPPAEAE